MIDVAKVQGQVHAQSVQKVGETRRKEPARGGFHHPQLAPRGRRLMPSAMSATNHHEKQAVREDIGGLMAELASRPQVNKGRRKLTGPERAAVLMLALGEQYGGKIFSLLDDDELREISVVMSSLGTIEAECGRGIAAANSSRACRPPARLLGNYDATERLLKQYLPPERVGGIMDEIRGPAGRNMWEKLANVQEEVLANYLKNEYPQTVAVVLSKLRAEHAARVLAILPEDLSLDVVNRMLKMEAVQKEVIERVEADAAHRIHVESVADPPPRRPRGDGGNLQQFRPADRNALPDRAGSRTIRDAAERIKALMFTFDDLIKLDTGSAQTLMRNIDKDKLAIALKGASETVRQFFFSNMSTRAAKMLVDDMQAMGPVRLRDVDEAQALLVNIAKDLAAKGEILISKSRGDEELIY